MRIKGRNFILHVGYMPHCYSYGVELAWGRRADVAEGESYFDDVVRWRFVDEITVRRWRNR